MIRSSLLHSRLVFSPFLHFNWRRSFVSSPHKLSSRSSSAVLSRRSGDCLQLRGFKMSAGGSDMNPDTDVAAVSVPPPLVHKSKIRYCQACGNPTKHIVPDGEEKLRAVCTACERIHYENPKMVVGCLVEHDNKVLLCKRNIEPSFGLWTLPAGYLEIGESAVEGAARETLEEACAQVQILSPFAQLDIPLIGQ